MSNSIAFHEAWKRHRKGVHDLRDAYEKRMKALESYRGSRGYDEDAAKAGKAFSDGLEALRAESRREFDRIFTSLEKHVSPEGMEPPTAEQLQLLQMLDMRDSLDTSELEQAMKTLGSNDAAVETLGQIAMRKGRTLPPSYKTKEQQRRYILDELKRAVNGLMAWDGRTRAEVVGDWARARNEFRWGSGEKVPEDARASMFVADTEAGAGAYDTMKALLPDVDFGTISAFMNGR